MQDVVKNGRNIKVGTAVLIEPSGPVYFEQVNIKTQRYKDAKQKSISRPVSCRCMSFTVSPAVLRPV